MSLFRYIGNIRIATLFEYSSIFWYKQYIYIYRGVGFGFQNGYIAALPILGKAGLKTLGRNNQHC